MHLKLGYAPLIEAEDSDTFETQLQNIASIEKDVIEFSPVLLSQLSLHLNEDTISLFQNFTYRSMHAPAVGVRYSSSMDQDLVDRILRMAATLKIQTLVFHPDVIDDFVWLMQTFGNKYVVAIENMDKNKTYGKTVTDLQEVFTKAPDAKWVFDLNHVYSLDPSMKFADELWNAFHDRIAHYHLSGYEGFHDCLCSTHEDIILSKIFDTTVPIVHEGGAARSNELLCREDRYVRERVDVAL